MENKYLLRNSEYIESPNHDDRPENTTIDSIIIHCISLPEREYDNDNVSLLFLNSLNRSHNNSFQSLEDIRVSSHLFIKRTGHIIQYVPFNKRAWHAGESQYKDRSSFNDFSIGIELHGSVADLYTDEQYRSLSKAIIELKRIFPSITDSNILGHSEIAPDRKFDPGPNFIWDRIK
tara:strand:- start:433 stop:960 length:528 start_codon:yes stop_codon:yes gene_type:complete